MNAGGTNDTPPAIRSPAIPAPSSLGDEETSLADSELVTDDAVPTDDQLPQSSPEEIPSQPPISAKSKLAPTSGKTQPSATKKTLSSSISSKTPRVTPPVSNTVPAGAKARSIPPAATTAAGRRQSLNPAASKPPTGTSRTLASSLSEKPRLGSTRSRPLTSETPAPPPSSRVQTATAKPRVTSPPASVTSAKTTSSVRPRPSTIPPSSTKQTSARTGTTTVMGAKKAGETLSKSLKSRSGDASLPNTQQQKDDALRISTLEQDLQRAENDLASFTVQADDERRNLQEDLAARDAECSELTRLKEEHLQRLSALKSELEELEIETQKSEGEKSSLQREKSEWRTKALESEETTNQVQSELSSLRTETETLRKDLQSSIANAEATAKAHNDQMKEVATDHEKNLEQERAENRRRLAELNDSISQLQNSQSDLDNFRAQIIQLEADAKTSRSSASELEVELLEVREELERLEEMHKKSLADLEKANTELSAASNDLKLAREDGMQKDQEYQRQQAQMSEKFGADLTAAVTASERNLEETRKARESSAWLQAMLEEWKDKHIKVEEDHQKTLQNLCASHKSQVSEVEEQLLRLKKSHLEKIESLEADHRDIVQKASSDAKSAAASEHIAELQALRLQSQSTIDQIQQANQAAFEDARASLTAETEDTVKEMRKRLADTELELKAARDDLSKTKQSLARAETDLKNLSAGQGKKTEPSQTESPDKTEAAAKIVQYQKELEAVTDELAGTRAAFQATKESIEAISQNHSRELEDLAKARVEEVTILQQTFDQQKEKLIKAKAEADERAREMEIELKDRKDEPLRATLGPRSNSGTGAPAISKEELVRLHEAHNMKLHSLEAGHRKGIQGMQDILDQVVKQKEELLIAGERRDMEMHFLTTENEESADRIKRLEDEIESLGARGQA